LSVHDLAGDAVLVVFWSVHCEICVREIPRLADLNRNYADRGLRVIAVAMPYDRPDQVAQLAAERAPGYAIALDVDGKILRAFADVPGTPTHYLIDTDGLIVARTVGRTDFDGLAKTVQKLLERRRSNARQS
jgi:peroxiredoxin